MFSSPLLPLPAGLVIASITMRSLRGLSGLYESEIVLSALFLSCRTSSSPGHDTKFVLCRFPHLLSNHHYRHGITVLLFGRSDEEQKWR